jgi:hypothetical protein
MVTKIIDLQYNANKIANNVSTERQITQLGRAITLSSLGVLICQTECPNSDSTGGWVLAPFNPQWPLLNLTVVPFAITMEPE